MKKTGYTEIDEILNWLQAKISSVLGAKLIGIYLYGSLVLGDFDYDISDIDLMVATETDIDELDFLNLNKIHVELVEEFKHWVDRIEISYISIKALQTIKTLKNKIAIISPGEAFNIKETGIDWLINCYLIQKQNIILFGPKPSTIIDKISKDAFLSAVKSQLYEWYDWITHTKNSYAYQSYAVLTICRALYVIQNGEQVSKKQAAHWAQSTYPEWEELIKKALSWRLDRQNKDIDPHKTYPDVEKFVRQFSKKN